MFARKIAEPYGISELTFCITAYFKLICNVKDSCINRYHYDGTCINYYRYTVYHALGLKM